MPADARQQHRSLEQQRNKLSEQLQEQIQTPELYQEGSELDNSKAAQMQMHSGNEAIQDLLDQLNNIDSALSDLDMEGQDEDFEEEVELDVEHGSSIRGGTDDGTDGDDDPWAQEFFHGGDEDPILIKRRRRRRKRITAIVDSKESMSDKQATVPTAPLLDDILPTPQQGQRTGDARYVAPELALRKLSPLIGHSLKPEELQFRQDVDDPIRLPVEIGKFLESESQNELVASWGSLLGAPDPSLLTPQGGFSTATGRLASLSICAEAMQGPPQQVDIAVQLSLHHNVWEHCRDIAKKLAHRGELHAPKIAQYALRQDSLPDSKGPLPKPNVLGGSALKRLLPAEMAFLKPSLSIAPDESIEEDDLLAQLDMILAEFTGVNPFTPPSAPMITSDMIHPALQSTNQILNALGRTQVEMATASVAVHRVRPTAPILSILTHCDDMLRTIARRAIQAGKQLESSIDKPLFECNSDLEQAISEIIDCHQNLQSLKHWALMTFASSVQVDSKDIQ